MVSERNGRNNNSERPALSGTLGADHEQPVGGGGSRPKEFIPRSEVQDVFFRGLGLLNERLATTANEYNVGATMARVRLRPDAIAKSHRHSTLFDRRRFQVAGVEQPGDILALVTQRSINSLTELVQNATQRQLAQLSAVAEVMPYVAPIESGLSRSVMTFFDGTLDDGSSLLIHGLRDLEERGVQLKPYGKMQNAYTTSSLPPSDSLQTMPWVRGVRPVRRFRLIARLATQPVHPTNISSVNQPLPLAIVGVIDSGIDTSIPGLQQLVVAQESHIPEENSDKSHGSLVGALAATGGGFTLDPNYFPPPTARLLDIQVVGSGQYAEIDEDDLLIQIEDAVARYGPQARPTLDPDGQSVVVWNLSMSSRDIVVSDDLFSLFARELDRIADENRIIFTVPSGNYENAPLRGWQPGIGPDAISNDADRISPPADAALSVTVGSLSDTSNPPTASPADYPSPFSRRGPGAGMLVKPDVVHFGGTCGEYGQQVQGIRGPHQNGALLESIGTSFAAPRVAAQLAQLVEFLEDPEPELLKLILLLSCTSRGDHDINDREMVNYYGFGFPENPAAILACDPWECIVLLRGEIRPGMVLHTPFPFPSCLEDQQRRRGFVRVGLVYTPVLDPSKGAEYCQTNVSASFGRQFDYPERDPRRYKREIPPLPQQHGISAQYERELIEHGWKWSPTKLYERSFTRMQIHPKELGWRLSAHLLLRRELEDRRDDVRQPFWMGIRIADPERRSPVYEEMRQEIEASALAQPIALRPRVIV